MSTCPTLLPNSRFLVQMLFRVALRFGHGHRLQLLLRLVEGHCDEHGQGQQERGDGQRDDGRDHPSPLPEEEEVEDEQHRQEGEHPEECHRQEDPRVEEAEPPAVA